LGEILSIALLAKPVALPELVSLRKFNRITKQDDLVEEVDFVEENPSYLYKNAMKTEERTRWLKTSRQII